MEYNEKQKRAKPWNAVSEEGESGMVLLFLFDLLSVYKGRPEDIDWIEGKEKYVRFCMEKTAVGGLAVRKKDIL